MPFTSPSLDPSPTLYPSQGIGPFTQQLLAAMAPWLAYDTNGHLYLYLVALGSMFDPVATIVSDYGYPDDPGYTPGWSILLDPDTCPTQFLPFLGQFVGVVVPPGTGDSDARALIRAEAGQKRGTATSVVTAAQRNLTGSQSCVLLERTPNAYAFQVVVRPEEVTSVAAITNAVNAVKPAGLTWQLIQTDGWALFQMEGSYGSVSALEAAFATVNGLEGDQVGH